VILSDSPEPRSTMITNCQLATCLISCHWWPET